MRLKDGLTLFLTLFDFFKTEFKMRKKDGLTPFNFFKIEFKMREMEGMKPFHYFKNEHKMSKKGWTN